MGETMTKPVQLTPEQREKHRREMERYRALTGGDLAQEVLDLIEENVQRWDQGSWRTDSGPYDEAVCTAPVTSIEAFAEDPLNPACTTSFCYAGWVGAVKGVKWSKANKSEEIGDPARCDCTGFCCIVPDHQVHIAVYARRQLGLDESDSDKLFHGDNTLGMLRRYTEEIVEYGEIMSDQDEDGDDDDY
jgi:hypothetical protein